MQSLPQSTPAGFERTVPDPLGATATVSIAAGPKLAVTDLAPSIVTVQGLVVPAHAPLQPEKIEPADAVAVSDTVVPLR